MILDISAICSAENEEEIKEVHMDMESLESKMGVFPIIKKEPFKLHLSNVENKRLLIQGEMDVTAAVPCDRCLTEVPTKLSLVIDKTLSIPALSSAERDEPETEDDNLEQLEYMNGYQLDADQMVYKELLTAWPMKVLCRDDCKGLCSKCGANLNETACGCDQTAIDPRMAAFQDVFNKFKEV